MLTAIHRDQGQNGWAKTGVSLSVEKLSGGAALVPVSGLAMNLVTELKFSRQHTSEDLVLCAQIREISHWQDSEDFGTHWQFFFFFFYLVPSNTMSFPLRLCNFGCFPSDGFRRNNTYPITGIAFFQVGCHYALKNYP